MALSLYYSDAYLAPLVSESLEQLAQADVADLGTFPAAWRDRLVVMRVYVRLCIDSMRSQDDLFSLKLAAYRKEWQDAVPQARAAQAEAEAAQSGEVVSWSPFTISLERG